jgi:hypothetical protein
MSTNLEIVRAIYAAGTTGDLEGMLRHIDARFTCYEAPSLPYGGEYHGPEGLSRLFQKVFSVWETFSVELTELLESGPTVVALMQLRVKLKGAGQTVEMPVVEIWRLRDGKVVELRPFYWDTAQFLPK